MVRRVVLGLLLCTLLNPVIAEDIDQVFTKSAPISWGESLKQFFGIADFNKSYAVVVGVNQFDDFDNLATTNDPIRVKDYLLNEAGFDSVRLITGKQVNLNKIRSIMQDEMPRTLGANDRFLFYWSGHGATEQGRNGKQFGYLPVSNSRKDAFSTMLSMNDLASWDDRLRAKQTLYLLDACFSGLASYQVKNDGRKQTLEQIARPSRQILTAGLASEETLVIDRLGGSVFTTALLDGLRGEADTSAGRFAKDGIISGRELELYVKKRVASESAKSGWRKSITPLLSQLDQREGDFFFFTEQTAAQSPLVKEAHSPLEAGVNPQSGGKQYNPSPDNAKAFKSRYVDHGNGTVTDTKTQLMWKQCSEGQKGGNCTQGKAIKYVWSEAIKRFSAHVSFAGYSDWRLPTSSELETLVWCSNGIPQQEAHIQLCSGQNDRGGDNYQRPTIDTHVFPNTQVEAYWSSTLEEPYIPLAKEVNFEFGSSLAFYTTADFYIRLVRSTQ